MNKLLKICLVLTLCAGLLMMLGCAKEDTKGNDPAQQTTEATTEGTEGEVDQTVTENPEGDPFDATDPAEDDGQGGNGGGGTGTPKPTEPDVGIDEDTEPTNDDFVIDFGDLT